jgi:hypothetical protein
METVEQMVQRLGIDLKVPEIHPEELAKATYIIIRHAYSEYNYKAQEVETAHGEHSAQMIALKGDPSMYDPGLHAIGKLQAETN